MSASHAIRRLSNASQSMRNNPGVSRVNGKRGGDIVNGESVNGGFVNAINLPHRPTFTLEEYGATRNLLGVRYAD